MSARLLTPGMLMDFSESRLDVLRHSGNDAERRVVTRLLDQPSAYQRWGAFHYPLMQKVAATRSRKEQLRQLRETNFSLLHRQALFDYLRGAQTTGRDRAILFQAFYGPTDYRRAVIIEHKRYLQSNCSLYCGDYLEIQVMRDTVFTRGFEDYRQRYMAYFSLYCDWVVAESHEYDDAMQPILLDMKKRLSQTAARLIALPENLPERRTVTRRWVTGWMAANIATD